MWRHARWGSRTKWIVTLVEAAPAGLLLLVFLPSNVGGGLFSSGSTIGSSCLNGPSLLATGPRNSIYVLDENRLLHIADGGDVLWQRPASAIGGLASDAQGNVYVNDPTFLAYQNRGWIEKFSASGRLLTRWPAQETEPDLVDRQGTLYALNTLDSYSTLVRRLSSVTGKMLGQWRGPVGSTLVSGPGGTLYAARSAFAQSERLLQVTATTGALLRSWPLCRGCSSLDALAGDRHGDLFAGMTIDGNTPFAISRLTLTGPAMQVNTINTAQEQVGRFAFDGQGNIYVIRDSYARGASNAGLDELSSSGSVMGTFQPCHPD